MKKLLDSKIYTKYNIYCFFGNFDFFFLKNHFQIYLKNNGFFEV
jgi:hypothetical protein